MIAAVLLILAVALAALLLHAATRPDTTHIERPVRIHAHPDKNTEPSPKDPT